MRLRRLLLAWITVLGSAAGAEPQALRWTSGDLPPYSWMSDKGPQGYAYELVVQMSGRMGRQSDVSFYPWARAVRMAREGEAIGTFPVLRIPEREAHFHWLISLGRIRQVFFVNGRGKLDANDVAALREVTVGVLRGSPILRDLREKNFTRVVEGKDYRDLLRLLSDDVIGAIYAGEPTLRSAIETLGHDQRDFRSGLSLGGGELFMAAGIRLDPAEAERWQKAYRELQADGTVARLQKKYFK